MSHPNVATDVAHTGHFVDPAGGPGRGQCNLMAGIGQPVLRREDKALLTGQGCYSDDFNQPGQAYAAMLRSPHAHADIRSIDTKAALAAPGVLLVLTAEDWIKSGFRDIPSGGDMKRADGSPMALMITVGAGSGFALIAALVPWAMRNRRSSALSARCGSRGIIRRRLRVSSLSVLRHMS